MILVILGTQDKQFPRLLEAIDKEIINGTIKEEVIVQAGQTKYQSTHMKIFDLIPGPEFDELLNRADLIITHGGAGSIVGAIKRGKKVIATPRLAKYKEHHNDHQKQIIGELAKKGYILELKDFQKIGKLIEKSRTFKPKKFESNTDHMIDLIEHYINTTNHTSWFHKYYEIISYLFFGGCTTLLNFLVFYLLCKIGVNTYISNGISWIISVLFAFIVNKKYVFHSSNQYKKELISFFGFRIVSLLFDMGILYLLVDVILFNKWWAKLITNIIVILLNYVFSKVFVFKNKG